MKWKSQFRQGHLKIRSTKIRLRFRYWIPDVSINLTRADFNIADATKAGAGGVEVLGYYVIVSPGNVVPTDWSIYGWSTPAWSVFF